MDTHFKKNVTLMLKKINQFNCKMECLDSIWDIIFPVKKNKWQYIRVTKYRETFYITLMDGDYCTLEVTQSNIKVAQTFGRNSFDHDGKNIQASWSDLIISVIRWLDVVKKDWIKANKIIYEQYPFNRRYGMVSNYIVRSCLSDIYQLDKKLGRTKTKKFINLVESGYFLDDKNIICESMTANDYFNYCKIAYIAGKRKDDYIDENLTGREMYKRYADGRDDGLLDIDGDSVEEFANWIDGIHPKKGRGGHPWEIKRGGNTTHIDLFVTRPSYSKSGFTVKFHGPSIGRLKETICMFLGVHEAGLPITIVDADGIRDRLLAQDNVGIVPNYYSLHRANQRFRDRQNVYEVLHYDDFGRSKRRILPFIAWEPLPILKPR